MGFDPAEAMAAVPTTTFGSRVLRLRSEPDRHLNQYRHCKRAINTRVHAGKSQWAGNHCPFNGEVALGKSLIGIPLAGAGDRLDQA
jgi:hypothetical protein